MYEFNTENYTDEPTYTHELLDFMQSLPEGIEYMIHLGAISDSGYNKPDIMMANTLSPRLISMVAVQLRAKLIFFSTCQAINPYTLYGYSKYVAEFFVTGNLDKAKSCILRPFNVYGGDESGKDNGSIPWKIENDPEFVVYRDCERDFIHVEDVCQATGDLIHKEWQSGIYELGTGEPVNIYDLYKVLTGKEPEKVATLPENVAPRSIARKSQMLKRFYPKYSVLYPNGREPV